MKRNSTFTKQFALTALAVAALGGTSCGAWALGLGRLQVNSALGEPLRAEIDVTSLSPEESESLRLNVASPEAYRVAGVEYSAVLPGTQVELRRRSDGRPFLRLTSERGVLEPFVDVILEINWATGRLVREYTLLFDPPNIARTPAPVTGAAAPGVTAPAEISVLRRSVEPRAPAGSVPAASARAANIAASRPKADPASIAELPSRPSKRVKVGQAGANEYRVKVGDSLSRIATRTLRPGVSLDQMLVALYRENPHAFIDNNMNRLKSGEVLAIPAAQPAQPLSESDARQFIQSQSADFEAYRQRVAAGVPQAEKAGNSRQGRGNVQSSPGERRAATPVDKLTLTKGATTGESSTTDERISRDREIRDAEIRLAELSKNLADLKRLAGATAAANGSPSASANMAPSGRSAALPSTGGASAPGQVAGSAAIVAPSPLAEVAAIPTPAPPVTPAVVSAPTPAPTVPKLASAPISSPVAAVNPPAASAPLPSSNTNGMAALLDHNPAALGLGGLLLALLAGFGIYRLTKRIRRESGETSFLESRLQPDSFFGASGGQRIDTRDAAGPASSMSYSLSQLDAIGDVDPVAEADVYLAYGRDLQAEEILKEAMRSTPARMAIRTKLLEVYAKRRDTKGFELLATQMFALTQGEGEDWVKAQEMGAQIDPENALYQPGGSPLVGVGGGEVSEFLGASTLPQSVLSTSSRFSNSVPAVLPASQGSLDLDLDLDLGPDAKLDLDLGNPETGVRTASSQIDVPSSGAALQFESSERPTGSDFSAFGFRAPPVVVASEPRPFNLADIEFDLDLPDASLRERAGATGPASEFNKIDLTPLEMVEDEPEVVLTRKLELAEEFRQIGDTDGARDLLQEVVTKASGAVKVQAERMLAALG